MTRTGYTKDLSDDEKRKNEIEAIKSILQNDPTNEYWQNRLTALTCSCFFYMGDNSECPVHGGTIKNDSTFCQFNKGGHHFVNGKCEFCNELETTGAFSADEIKADYQERNYLYAMGMGY